jgi:DNA-binding NtrC family response regulator
VLGIQDLSEQQGSPRANAEPCSPAEAEQAIDALRRILVGQTIADVERHLILDTLSYCFGNRTHAARILGISIRTLRNKLNEYMEAGIAVPEPGQKPAIPA